MMFLHIPDASLRPIQRADWKRHKLICKHQLEIGNDIESRTLSAPREVLCHDALSLLSEEIHDELAFALKAAHRIGHPSKSYVTKTLWMHFMFDPHPKVSLPPS